MLLKVPGDRFSPWELGGAYEISGITIQANAADTFSTGETFTIAIYSGTPGTFAVAGSFGSVTPAYLDANSGLSLVGSEIFTATTATGSSAGTGQVASSEFVTFNFSSGITVDGGVNLALVVFNNFAFSCCHFYQPQGAQRAFCCALPSARYQ